MNRETVIVASLFFPNGFDCWLDHLSLYLWTNFPVHGRCHAGCMDEHTTEVCSWTGGCSWCTAVFPIMQQEGDLENIVWFFKLRLIIDVAAVWCVYISA